MQNCSDAFDAVMEPIISAYMTWDLKQPIEGCIEIEEGPPPLSRKTKDRRVMRVLDIFHLYFYLSSVFV